MSESRCIESLVELGFSRMESSVYVFLLGESPATGYRVAPGIGKPTANTYKAIETLAAKGLIVVEDDTKRLYRAIPYEEMLREFERGFEHRRQAAAAELAHINPSEDDHRVYSLRSRGHVLERCRSMLERARQQVLVDAFPDPLSELIGDLQAIAARGVDVTVKVYRPTTIDGATTIDDYRGVGVVDCWAGQWLNLVVDAEQHLLAYLTDDATSVRQAVWSGSPYLSWIHRCGIASEITLDALVGVLDSGGTLDDVRGLLEPYRPDGERGLGGRLALERLSQRALTME